MKLEVFWHQQAACTRQSSQRRQRASLFTPVETNPCHAVPRGFCIGKESEMRKGRCTYHCTRVMPAMEAVHHLDCHMHYGHLSTSDRTSSPLYRPGLTRGSGGCILILPTIKALSRSQRILAYAAGVYSWHTLTRYMATHAALSQNGGPGESSGTKYHLIHHIAANWWPAGKGA